MMTCTQLQIPGSIIPTREMDEGRAFGLPQDLLV